VQKGITADDGAGAQRILAALRDQRLPVCPAVPDGTPAAEASAAASPTTTPPAGDGQPPSPATALPTTAPPTTAGPMVPGVDCREGK
jgi:protein phosphatase